MTTDNKIPITFYEKEETDGQENIGQTGGGWRESMRRDVLYSSGQIKTDTDIEIEKAKKRLGKIKTKKDKTSE